VEYIPTGRVARRGYLSGVVAEAVFRGQEGGLENTTIRLHTLRIETPFWQYSCLRNTFIVKVFDSATRLHNYQATQKPFIELIVNIH